MEITMIGLYRLGGPPHHVIMTLRDNKDYIRVLVYSYYTTITGWVGGSSSYIGFRAYLEGQGDLVSRVLTPITHIVTLVLPLILLLTKSP